MAHISDFASAAKISAKLSIKPSSTGSISEYTKSDDIVLVAELKNTSATKTFYILRWGSPIGSTDETHKFNIKGPTPMPSVSISRTPITAEDLEALPPGSCIVVETRFNTLKQSGKYNIEATPVQVYTTKDLGSGRATIQFVPSKLALQIM